MSENPSEPQVEPDAEPSTVAAPSDDDGRLEAVTERIDEARAAADVVAEHHDITDEARQAEAEAARAASPRD